MRHSWNQRRAGVFLVGSLGSVLAACGGSLSNQDDAGAADAAPHVDASRRDVEVALDAGPPPYQPQGVKCSPPDAGAPRPWAPGDAGEAPVHPPVMAAAGGPVIANPVFVPMTFNGDEFQPEIDDLMDSIGCTTYWHAVAPDYGVNDGYSTAPVHMSDTPPASIDDTQIAQFIESKIAAHTVPQPIDGQTLYVIFYPDATTDITLDGSHSCSNFGGYHNEYVRANQQHVPYAVLPRCGSFGTLSGFDAISGPTSHELFEAASDPLVMSTPAYDSPVLSGFAWALGGGGEIGDLCEFNSDAFFTPSDYPFVVQHVWSSSAAYGGRNPCQPTTDTFFAAAPIMTDSVTLMGNGGSVATQGVALAVGGSKTITISLVASGSWPDPISVSVVDGSAFFGGVKSLSFALSPATGSVGDALQLTINRFGGSVDQYGGAPFVVMAQSDSATHMWWGVVGN